MLKPTVYLETSVIGYATSRISADLVTAARQHITRTWFEHAPATFRLFVSQFVVQEVSAGDAHAARERLKLLEGIPLLVVPESVDELTARLLEGDTMPANAREDAFHIAVAAANGMEFLLTWNYKHIANLTKRENIDSVCRASGYEPPVICTPEELLNAFPPR